MKLEYDNMKASLRRCLLGLTVLALAGGVLPGCSDDMGEKEPFPGYATLVVSLGSLGNAVPVYTRATTGREEDTSYERYIKDWWIVVMKDDKVDRVLSNTKDDIAQETGGADSRHEVSVPLLIGESYDLYAFANLPDENKEYLNDLGEGEVFDKTKTVGTIDATGFDDGSTQAGPYFPMSSYKESVAVEATTSSVEIPLIRLVGKVTVSLTNTLNDPITLNGLSLNGFRTSGDIYLLPYDEAMNKTTRNLLDDDMNDSYIPIFPASSTTENYTEKVLVGGTAEEQERIIDAGGSDSFQFYTNETDFMKIEGLNNLQVTVDVEDRDNTPKDTEFSFIRRNDWLRIPLQISDVKTDISFDMRHMPIGGLPTTITMGAGVIVPEYTYSTRGHGGDITITYELDSISSLKNAKLKHYDGSSYLDGKTFTSAVLVSNNDEDSPLLINVPENNAAAPWLEDTAKAFSVKATEGSEGKSGSFTVTAQELANTATAEIQLTLVIEGTNQSSTTSTVSVPYTIRITNQSTTGGN
ncbi:hypothetical protein [uncultured Parabacteroides sp.]|uniref:hypothetical protein n=1 Tax=uncultured Parabacteroides sp. TaxID=512312 RepID=UPI0026165519|nr:hypothetical protein [uncultured Parabacteroides sp.]